MNIVHLALAFILTAISVLNFWHDNLIVAVACAVSGFIQFSMIERRAK